MDRNYCEKCDERYDNPKFKHCPLCGCELTDYKTHSILKEIHEFCDDRMINRCHECGEDFSLDYKYCPICANPLKKENQFWIDEENMIVKAHWNKDEIIISFDEIHHFCHPIIAEDVPEPITTIHLLWYFKPRYDEKLEKAFQGRKVPKKLTCRQMAKLVGKLDYKEGIDYGFMNSEMVFDKFGMNLEELQAENPKMIVVKLRKDLFYLFECQGRIFLP